MEFNDEQMTAINEMIAAKVTEATAPLSKELASRDRTITSLQNDKTAAATAAETAEAERLATSGTLEDFKQRATTLEGEKKQLEADLRTIRFDNAITAAVGSANIRPELREDLVDALRYRAKYADGKTSVNGQDVDAYLADFLTTERGKFYVPAPNNGGGGAMGAQGETSAPKLTKENFSTTAFLALSKAERAVFLSGDHGLKPDQVALLRSLG